MTCLLLSPANSFSTFYSRGLKFLHVNPTQSCSAFWNLPPSIETAVEYSKAPFIWSRVLKTPLSQSGSRPAKRLHFIVEQFNRQFHSYDDRDLVVWGGEREGEGSIAGVGSILIFFKPPFCSGYLRHLTVSCVLRKVQPVQPVQPTLNKELSPAHLHKVDITAVSLFAHALLPVPFFSSELSRLSFYTTWSRWSCHFFLTLSTASTILAG